MSEIQVNTINEYTGASGVTIDGLLIKDGAIPSISGGLEEVDIWHLTADFTGDANPISSNLSRFATNWEKIGTGMTESSGTFSFPSTGKWQIEFIAKYTTNPSNAGERAALNYIQVTTNNSSYVQYAPNTANMYSTATSIDGGAYTALLLDVTDTANVKVKLSYNSQATTVIQSGNATSVTFTKIANT